MGAKQTKFRVACERGDIDVVRRLLAHKRVNPAHDNNVAIRRACQNGHVEIVRLLLGDSRINPTDYSKGAMQRACENGDVDIVRRILDDGVVNPADDNNQAIRSACQYGHLNVVLVLMADSRVNPADCSNHAIRLACENGHVDVVRLLLMDSRIDIHDIVSTCPKMVEKCGKDEPVCALLALAGIKPFCDKYGPLDPGVYSLDKLRHWQRTLYINLYKQGDEFRNGPYGVLLKHRLKVADLYGCTVLTSRLPLEMIELVLGYMR